jgi:glyoxylase-like metal-dependent hydrolase (beta-lactamase superfamily II)
MIQGTELSPGAWVLRNSENERNMTALFDAQDDGPVVGVDPGELPVELDALDKFAEDMGRSIGALLLTQERESSLTLGRWPTAIVITPTSARDAPLLPLPASGWETVPLAPGRLGVFRRKSGILLCGELLRSGVIPNLDGGADAYLQSLEAIEALDPKLVVPRQGAPGQGKREVRARIAADREYTQNLVRHVLTSMAARLPLERVLSVARDIYEDYPFLEQHLRNLEACWREFEGTGFQK